MKSANRHNLIVIVALLALVGIACLAASSKAEAHGPDYVAHLRAESTMQKWQSPQQWTPQYGVTAGIWIEGVQTFVPDLGCGGNWVAGGVAFHVYVCGSGKQPIRLHYVSLFGTRDVIFRYHVRRVA